MFTTEFAETAETKDISKNNKFEIPNIKRFDKLTVLSKVEGQAPIVKIKNYKRLSIVV
jgi:hypothetical protein